MKILLYGDSYVSELVERVLMQHHEVIGYVPCKAPAFPGQMQSPKLWPPSELGSDSYDLALSVFYDRKVGRLSNAYNLHPGLLPRWGGCNILYHTIVEKAREQGLTFHKMTEEFDAGPIVTKATYPVYEHDFIWNLYTRVCALAPGVALAGIDLASHGIWTDSIPPSYYPRSLPMARPGLYLDARTDIEAWIRSQR